MALNHSAGAIGTNNPSAQISVTNWNAAHVIDSNGIDVPSPTAPATIPAVPAAANTRMFTRSLAGKQIAACLGPSGAEVIMQAHHGRQKIGWWSAAGGNSTTTSTMGLPVVTAVGAVAARAEATTNIATRMRRLTYSGSATAGTAGGLYYTVASYTVGTGAGLGGFTFVTRFVVADAAAVTGAIQFVGMSNLVAAPVATTAPSALTNCIGLAQLSTDATQWYIVYGGSAAQTAIALGTAIGAPTLTTTAWEFSIFSGSNVTSVNYMLTNLGTGTTVTGTLSGTPGTALPANTTFLAPRLYRSNNATALAVSLDISNIYIETDF